MWWKILAGIAALAAFLAIPADESYAKRNARSTTCVAVDYYTAGTEKQLQIKWTCDSKTFYTSAHGEYRLSKVGDVVRCRVWNTVLNRLLFEDDTMGDCRRV